MAARNTEDEITPVSAPPPVGNGREKAAEFLAAHSAEDVSFTYEEERAVVWRIDKRVLVLMLWAYFFQQLDKSTLSYVSIFGLTTDAKLVGKQYSWLGSIVYLAQLVMQPLVALVLVRVPVGKVLATAIFLWGASLSIMAACTDFHSLLGLRFCLGAFEAFIAPCCVAITQMWWRRSEQTMRTSYWNAMNGVTSIVGSLFTYGLGHIHSATLFRYQIVFMFCGLLTVLYSVVVLLCMPDSPMEAKCLSDREKLVAVERLRANQMGVVARQWRWDHVREVALDAKTYLWFVAIFTISIASGGIGTFGSLIVKSFGFSSFATILFNIPFGVVQVLAITISGWLASRFQRKGLVIALVSILPTVGSILMLTLPRSQKGGLLFGYYLVSIMACITPLIYAWQAQNTAGDTKRKCTSAVVFVGMCAGNVVGPLLYSTDDAPLYRKGLIVDLVMFATVGVTGGLIPIYLAFLNKKHEMRRVALGKPAQIADESMMRSVKLQGGKTAEAQEENADPTVDIVNDNGLHDTTDLQNEDFIYTY